ncbi:hypothetical protein ScPMuIL_001814 [Solemya velum]
MATDSIRVIDDSYVRRIHNRNPSGHLHKGHGVVAATSSIPSKYQTIVTDNTDNRGFLQKSKRFQPDMYMTECPGPGNYVQHGALVTDSVSFSKKGTGSFASKSKRNVKHLMSNAPGPGIYGLPGTVSSKKDFNHAASSRAFSKPIAQPIEHIQDHPAPNQYNVLDCKTGKNSTITAEAAFKSKSKREMLNLDHVAKLPAPGQYNVNDELLHLSAKVPISSFKSKSKRQMQPDPPTFPGPGTYHPDEPVEPADRQIFPRKHYLCISAPAMPLPRPPKSPGPGSYEIVDFEGPTKHYMSSAMFVSTASRWTGGPKGSQLPGPAHYRPLHTGKQSLYTTPLVDGSEANVIITMATTRDFYCLNCLLQ